MSEHQRRKYFTSLGHRDPSANQGLYATGFHETNIASPRKRNAQNELTKKEHGSRAVNDSINKIPFQEFAAFNGSPEDKKFKGLIIDAISSADRAVKAILPYGHTEIQKYCSDYFLKKEKLLSFLQASNLSLTNSDKNSKKNERRKTKKKENVDSDLTEMVPINHLERLENIVYNKIIPLLQNEFQHEKKKSQKLIKKGKEWGNSDLKEGIMLLDRLNQKERIAVDECAELLQKFIVKTMEKEEKMMGKLARFQEKLDQQIKKGELLSEQANRLQEKRAKSQKQWNKQRKSILRYQQFSKEIQLLFIEKEKIPPEASEKQRLQDILRQIKKILNNEEKHNKREKKCDHKYHKQSHASCKEQASRNEQQIKSLKDVVKSLDKEIGLLRQQCENMDNKLQHSHDKVSKYQSKSKKIIEENQQMNKRIEELIKEEKYKSKLIEEYLKMIAKLEETLRSTEENVIKLNEENDSYLELIAKNSSEKDQCLRHLMQMEEKSKQAQQLISRKDIEIEQLINSLFSKQKQLNDNQKVVEKLSKEVEELYKSLRTKEISLESANKINEELQAQIKRLQQFQLPLNYAYKKDHQTSLQIHSKEQNQRINVQTLQTINNQSQQRLIANSRSPLSLDLMPEAVKEVNQIVSDSNLKKEERDDFIPARINKQTLEELIVESKSNQPQQTLDRIEINNINQDENYKEGQQDQLEIYVSHTLEDQIEPKDPPISSSHIDINSHNSKDVHNSANYIKVEELQGQNINKPASQAKEDNQVKLSEQLVAIQAQSQKIQQLIDLNLRITDHFNKIKQKIGNDEQSKKDIAGLKEEMDCLTMMLNISKINNLKKLQRISRTELLHQEAQEQIERLKHKLDDALIANRPFSQIQENSDGSGFTIPDHIQSFFKSNQDPYRQSQQIGRSRGLIRPKGSKDFCTQTDAEVQTSRLRIMKIQSEVVVLNSSPIVSDIEEKELEVDKSFIEDLEMADISPVSPNPSPGTYQFMENSQEFKEAMLPNSLKDTPVIEKDLNPSIDLHRQRVVINELLPQSYNQLDQRLQTPHKRALQDSEYVRNIMNAPEKQKKQGSKTSRSQVVEFHHEIQIEQMKEMFTHRENEFSELVIQKDQQIERLKSIIKTLTKAQAVEERASASASRNKQSANRQMQILKNENEQLWMFLEKQKSEIEKLRILIDHYELQQSLHKIKSKSPKRTLQQITEKEIEDNQAFVIDITPVKEANEITQHQVKGLSRSQHSPQERQSHQLLLQTEKKEGQNYQLSPDKLESPTKRFARKSQRFIKEESPRQRRHTTPKTTMQFDWQDLVPQFFGEKEKRQYRK